MAGSRPALPNVTYRQGADWPGYARQVLGWNWLTWLLNFADRGLIGPLLPLIIAAFGISYGEAGGIVSLFFVGYLATFVGGVLSDRFGRKRLSVFSVFGFGAATCATALATGPGFLATVRVGTGVFEGLQYPTGGDRLQPGHPARNRVGHDLRGLARLASSLGGERWAEHPGRHPVRQVRHRTPSHRDPRS